MQRDKPLQSVPAVLRHHHRGLERNGVTANHAQFQLEDFFLINPAGTFYLPRTEKALLVLGPMVSPASDINQKIFVYLHAITLTHPPYVFY